MHQNVRICICSIDCYLYCQKENYAHKIVFYGHNCNFSHINLTKKRTNGKKPIKINPHFLKVLYFEKIPAKAKYMLVHSVKLSSVKRNNQLAIFFQQCLLFFTEPDFLVFNIVSCYSGVHPDNYINAATTMVLRVGNTPWKPEPGNM